MGAKDGFQEERKLSLDLKGQAGFARGEEMRKGIPGRGNSLS